MGTELALGALNLFITASNQSCLEALQNSDSTGTCTQLYRIRTKATVMN